LKLQPLGTTRLFFARRRILVIAVVLALLFFGGFYGFFFRNNFGVVEAGRVYRSAQPKSELKSVLAMYRIATVLNLRGGSKSDWWYADEVKATRDIDFFDFPLSAERRPSRNELLKLVDLFQRCKYPLLIHCKSGSDRTGLACALYLLCERQQPPNEAVKAFSLKYGHVPLNGPQHLHEPLDEYSAWLAAHALAHTPATFVDWLRREYRSTDVAKFTPLQPGPRNRMAARLEKSARR
jgi:hypothetical protein